MSDKEYMVIYWEFCDKENGEPCRAIKIFSSLQDASKFINSISGEWCEMLCQGTEVVDPFIALYIRELRELNKEEKEEAYDILGFYP